LRIFLSHHESAKPLVREVREYLPAHVNTWIDEYEILLGASLADSIQTAIQADADFMVLFLDQHAAESPWVQTELQWALDEEHRLGRPFVIPVLLEDGLDASQPWLRERLCLKCAGFTEAQVHGLADELSSALFAWLSRDLDALRAVPARSEERLLFADRADALLEDAAALIRHLVFPYRRDRPMKLTDLLHALQSDSELGLSSIDELHALLYRLRDRKMISGIALTGSSIFVGEEHLNWRSQEAVRAKRAVAEHLVDEIEDKAIVYLDAGSSTLAVCKAICRGIQFRQWHELIVVTNAVPIAAEFSELANRLGMEEDDTRLRVVVPGGEMRLNTSALVGESPAVLPNVGELRYDLAVIGTNGVSYEYGCTTTAASEAESKRCALERARRRIVLAEPAKYGIWQTESFASFQDGLTIMTACEGADARVETLARQLEHTPSDIVVIEISPEDVAPPRDGVRM